MRRRSGIPTSYQGVRFRSRLEARWAAFFDQLRWPWDYEPCDLVGYIPDFVCRVPGLGDLLVEVKPSLGLAGTLVTQAQVKIRRAGWTGPAMIVGTRLHPEDGHLRIGVMSGSQPHGEWLPVHLFSVDGDTKQVLTLVSGSVGDDQDLWVTMMWREAGNQVQWRKR